MQFYIICLGLSVSAFFTSIITFFDIINRSTFIIENSTTTLVVFIVITLILYGISGRTSRCRDSLCPLFVGITFYALYVFIESWLNTFMSTAFQNYILLSTSFSATLLFGYIAFWGPRLTRRLRARYPRKNK